MFVRGCQYSLLFGTLSPHSSCVIMSGKHTGAVPDCYNSPTLHVMKSARPLSSVLHIGSDFKNTIGSEGLGTRLGWKFWRSSAPEDPRVNQLLLKLAIPLYNVTLTVHAPSLNLSCFVLPD